MAGLQARAARAIAKPARGRCRHVHLGTDHVCGSWMLRRSFRASIVSTTHRDLTVRHSSAVRPLLNRRSPHPIAYSISVILLFSVHSSYLSCSSPSRSAQITPLSNRIQHWGYHCGPVRGGAASSRQIAFITRSLAVLASREIESAEKGLYVVWRCPDTASNHESATCRCVPAGIKYMWGICLLSSYV